MVDVDGGRWGVVSELAPAALAVAGVGHALADEVDKFSGLEQPLRLRTAANTLAVYEHSRNLQR